MQVLRSATAAALMLLVPIGCSTMKSSNTARTATEQLLISNSVDDALAKVDFRPFAGRKVYLEEKYIDSVDKNYIIASLRHQLLHAGSRLVAKPDEAELIVEARAGAVGTDMKETFVGVPQIAVPGPFPINLPEVRLVSRSSQVGTAKIGLVAYDAATKRAIGTGGLALSQSDTNNWYVLGVGPFQNGSIRSEVASQTAQPARGERLPNIVAFERPIQPRRRDSGRIRVTGGEWER